MNTIDRPRRSVKLNPDEKRLFAKKVASFDTKEDAAAFFNFNRQTLRNILLAGSGSAENISIIREKINAQA